MLEESEEEAAMQFINVGSSRVHYPSFTSGYYVITVGLKKTPTHLWIKNKKEIMRFKNTDIVRMFGVF